MTLGEPNEVSDDWAWSHRVHPGDETECYLCSRTIHVGADVWRSAGGTHYAHQHCARVANAAAVAEAMKLDTATGPT